PMCCKYQADRTAFPGNPERIAWWGSWTWIVRNGNSRPDSRKRCLEECVWVLTAAQIFGGLSPIIISLGGLVGQQLAPRSSAATLPVSLLNLGLAVGTLPAAARCDARLRPADRLVPSGATLGAVAGPSRRQE
ncbi:hypothetical protein O3W52_01795, partial [Ensifer psoraleae]|nr:hypothetical protein [Sinorhizobium psoraleae]